MARLLFGRVDRRTALPGRRSRPGKADLLARGFTLIELLVVMAIIGLLVALLLPAVQMVREAARSVQCKNHLKQMGIALHNYHASINVFPPGYIAADASDPLNTAPGWGWASMLLPFLDQTVVFNRCNFDLAVEHPANTTAYRSGLSVFMCPTDTKAGAFDELDNAEAVLARELATNSYAACFGSGGDIDERPDLGNGLFFRNSRVCVRDVIDGTHSTLAIGERSAALTQTAWAGAVASGTARVTPGAPVYSHEAEEGAVQVLAFIGEHSLDNPACEPTDFFSLHQGGVHFLMTDGSVRLIKRTVDFEVLHALATRAGGEPLDGTQY